MAFIIDSTLTNCSCCTISLRFAAVTIKTFLKKNVSQTNKNYTFYFPIINLSHVYSMCSLRRVWIQFKIKIYVCKLAKEFSTRIYADFSWKSRDGNNTFWTLWQQALLCGEINLERRNYFLKIPFSIIWRGRTRHFHVCLGSQWILTSVMTWTSFLVQGGKEYSKCASIQAVWGGGDVKVYFNKTSCKIHCWEVSLTVALDSVKLSKLVNWIVLGCSLKCLIAWHSDRFHWPPTIK